MSCEGLEVEVAELEQQLDRFSSENGEKPVGRAMLMAALARARAQLKACRGEKYVVELVLIDVAGSVPPHSVTGRIFGTGGSVALTNGHLSFATPPTSAGLVVSTTSGETLARSPPVLPRLSSGRSELSILLPRPIVLTPTVLTDRIPAVTALPRIPTVMVQTGLGPLTIAVTLSGLSVSLGAGSVAITLTGRIVTGPSAAQAATTLFSHTANYFLSPIVSPLDVARSVGVSAPAAGTLTLTPTAGWAFFRPLGTTLLWAFSSTIEASFREQIASVLDSWLNAEIRAQVAGAVSQAPLPANGVAIASMRSIIVRSTGIALSPSVSVHV